MITQTQKPEALSEKQTAPLDKVKETLGKAGPLVALILICAFLTITTDAFLTADNLLNVVRQAACNGFIAIGMMLAILTGGIDLSVGSTMALSMVIMAKCIEAGVPSVLCIAVCLAVGAFLGLINGLLLTMGTPISGMPAAVKWIGAAYIGPIPACTILLIFVYIIMSFFLRDTTLGRHIYAFGGNRVTARLSGVNVDFTLCSGLRSAA